MDPKKLVPQTDRRLDKWLDERKDGRTRVNSKTQPQSRWVQEPQKLVSPKHSFIPGYLLYINCT